MSDDTKSTNRTTSETVPFQAEPDRPEVASPNDDAWRRVIGLFIDNELRSSPASANPEGWGHLMAVLPKIRDYVEKELDVK